MNKKWHLNDIEYLIKNYEKIIKDQEINKLNHIIKKLNEENASLSKSIKNNKRKGK